MKKLLLAMLLFIGTACHAIDFYGVYPSNWWVGMKTNKIQLMLYGERVGQFTKVSINHPGVVVNRISRLSNKNYLFADITISPRAKPGRFKIILSGGGLPSEDVSYELKSRRAGKRMQAVNAEDFIYLMIPDRFSNGDPSNDIIEEYRDREINRKSLFSRHGGDFRGIENHFPYLKELGVTTLWLTPVVENNTDKMKEWGNEIAGYHGYWFTDHYQVDKRLGGNEGYLSFCDAAHRNGLKVIQDAVYNHVARQHWMALDPPSEDWINNWPSFTGPSHREETLFDPYGSSFDKQRMLDGWFIDHLPDLNLRNTYLANFLVQHAVWTTEYFGIDGWRVDTYKYCDEKFLNRVNTALEKEFPGITVLGEAWVNSTIANAYFTKNNTGAAFKHNAPGTIDFQINAAMLSGMSLSQGWTDGVNKLYMTLAQDFVYRDPLKNCIFLDNHDMDRVYSTVNEDWKKLKMGLTWLLTLRGIPQLYYGTEVLMKNKKTGLDGASVREDFPGGWAEDPVSRFSAGGRTEKENEVFNYIKALANYRKMSPALTTGKTKQFVPVNGQYVFFRYDEKQVVMVIANSSDKPVKPNWDDLKEMTTGFSRTKDIISGQIASFHEIELAPADCRVLELVK